MESHWKTTGRLQEAHYGHIGNSQATHKIIYRVAFQKYTRYEIPGTLVCP